MASPSRRNNGKERALEDNAQFMPMTVATYRHLTANSSTGSDPFRCIAHVDIDAAYAAMEMSRLKSDPSVPLAVRQWNGLIAVNYAARKFGISRHESPAEALKKCPELVMVHVATYRGGDTEPGYWEGDDVLPTTHKVSLDPYRRESLKIIQVFQEFCPVVEKASIDESYLDLSQTVRNVILARYPVLASLPAGRTAESPLPSPAEIGITIDWPAFGNIIPINPVVHTIVAEGETSRGIEQVPVFENYGELTWGDVALSIGADIVRTCRSTVESKLGYTCSAGIAPNKILAKLCSARFKPNAQTILRIQAVPAFLRPMHFTTIRGLGGKLGSQVILAFKIETIGDLLMISIDRLQAALGDQVGLFVWEIARGIDEAEVEAKTLVKSMLSSKNFKPSITTYAEASHWLNILATELHLRLSESRDNNPGLWPKTITFAHRSDNYVSKSHQVAFPFTTSLTIPYIAKLAEKLLRVAILSADKPGHTTTKWEGETKVGPYSNMQLTFSGLEKLEEGQKGIERFFSGGHVKQGTSAVSGGKKKAGDELVLNMTREQTPGTAEVDVAEDLIVPTPSPDFICSRCAKSLSVSSRAEHADYHFARDMYDTEKEVEKQGKRKRLKGGSNGNPDQNGNGSERRRREREVGQNTLKGFFSKRA